MLTFVLGLLRTYDGGRINVGAIVEVLVRSGKAAVEIILICAIAGIIIALFARSGLSFGMGFFLVQLGKSSLLLLLVVTAMVCIILGMGLPTVGVYLLLSTLAAPPLIQLGLLPMAAHLFVLYFGMLSMLTPPVAIAAFVAANMAKAPPMATGWEAVRIAWPAFLVPFLFAASPQLLLYGSPLDDVLVISTAVVGVYLITAGIVGYLNRTLARPQTGHRHHLRRRRAAAPGPVHGRPHRQRRRRPRRCRTAGHEPEAGSGCLMPDQPNQKRRRWMIAAVLICQM